MKRFFHGREKGDAAECRAQLYLEQQGLRTLAQNYLCRAGEIDIIMQHREMLVFVEVRYRKHARFGSAAESITPGKQKRIIRAANHYLTSHNLHNRPCRFDVVAITGEGSDDLDWIPNAFQQELA